MATTPPQIEDSERQRLLEKMRLIASMSEGFLYYNPTPSVTKLRDKLKDIEQIAHVK